MTTINKIKASKDKCKRQRDNWKRKALAYREIIERARNSPDVCKDEILDEADKLDKETSK